ncbi:palmitoyltransferase ZDHHC7 isoform X2 [Aethina tumida]|uniref:palmitoyltransferase ZDHHC7 isoform X2 n=1 Tax=Aethina tumida TaxID=116153 RepID=UPI002147415B|nr:palmitoyltransferase ZDHHC7 isoform X2 [Aethina tumida]
MFIRDPCGIVCILVTYAAVFYADYVVVKWIVFQTMIESLWGAFNVVMFNTVIFLLTMSHLKAVVTDPGTVPLDNTDQEKDHLHADFSGCDWTMCTRCDTYRPPRAHHCRICQRCIKRMDHHCPWINNCVGERNQKYFIQFLIYVGILSAYAIVLVVVSWLTECKDCQQNIPLKQARIEYNDEISMRSMHCVILLLESALFGMFVSAILVDQIQAILSDETAVEQVQHQGPFRPHKEKMALLAEVCGRQHPFLWLLPCSGVPRKHEYPDVDHVV